MNKSAREQLQAAEKKASRYFALLCDREAEIKKLHKVHALRALRLEALEKQVARLIERTKK